MFLIFAPSSRMGSRAASLHSAVRSLPEYPSVKRTRSWNWRSVILCFWEVSKFFIRESLVSASGSGTYTRFTSRLRAASSNSSGLFVAPITRTRSSDDDKTPSNCTRNSVLSRRLASCSEEDRSVNMESISSIKITEGCSDAARPNSALIIFSLSPTHFETRFEALILKKVARASDANALASMVLPVPGGPNNSIPFAGDRRPVNSSGLKLGNMTISLRMRLASFSPAISSQ
mmetsp:Transcript_29373/g.49409  ORF Transcript_29373/g.49409 Transcript_29373/m.49409 type:complete len:232 (-) Transcript_29373:750-1445(-)